MAIRVAEFSPYFGNSMPERKPNGMPAAVIGGNDGDKSIFECLTDFENLKNDVECLEKIQNFSYAGGIVPTVRRLGSLPGSLEEDDLLRSAMLGFVALLHLPSDVTQMALAARETPKLFANGLAGFEKKEFQRNIYFLKGTFMDRFFNKEWLKKYDKTLAETKFGEMVKNIFRMENKNDHAVIRKVFQGAEDIPAIRINGNSVQKVVGGSLLRIPVIGLFVSAAMEVPAIVKATKTEGTIWDKIRATGAQLVKSSGFIALTTALIAVGGRILFPYGILAEFAGMAIGSAIGIMASKALDKKIDSLFKNNEAEKNPFAASVSS